MFPPEIFLVSIIIYYLCNEILKESEDMATISLNPTLYSRAQNYAKADGMSVEEWVAMLISRFSPARKKKYKMKKIEELSPVLQGILNMPRTGQIDADDVNGTQARDEYYKEKYDLA